MRPAGVLLPLLLCAVSSTNGLAADLETAKGASARAQSGISPADRARLAEAFRLADRFGDRLWKGWSKAPFAVLLIDGEHEFLVRHPRPPEDFTALQEDPVLGCRVWTRARQFDPRLLATFPVAGVPTIVIGRAEATSAKGSTQWVLTVLHEHFHQWQDAMPGYYPGTAALDLAGDDRTGMWMLNYPFPYEDPAVATGMAEASKALLAALQAAEASLPAALAAFRHVRSGWESGLSPKDARYSGLQEWQEGVARYTELRMAELAATVDPGKGFRALPDVEPYSAAAAALRKQIETELALTDLPKEKRLAFYAWGAGEALLLDRVDPGWRSRYLDRPFSLREHFEPPHP